jgi:catechol 2,3-dioxygenase-like lactoylglutathione lyase family enzyme
MQRGESTMLNQQQVFATLPASDIDRARSFYEDTLGFQADNETAEGVSYRAGDGNGFLVFPSSGKPSGSHTQLTFRVDDLEREMRELKERGVRFEAVDMEGYDPETSIVRMGTFRGAWFRDSEGNLIAVGEGVNE